MIHIARPPAPAPADLIHEVGRAKEQVEEAERELRYAQLAVDDPTPWIALAVPRPVIGPARTVLTRLTDDIAADLAAAGYRVSIVVEPTEGTRG